MAWIELHQELVEHKKMDRLVRETGVERATALGRLCILWLWALGHRPDGDLSDLDAARLGRILGLGPRKAAAFLEGLVASGFLDREGQRLAIHDWQDYAGRLLESRRKNIERTQRNRIRKKQTEEGDVSRNVCETFANVSPLPYPTVPNPTAPYPTLSSSGADAVAQADADAMAEYLHERGLRAEEWFGATPELLQRSRSLTDALFHVFCTRKPTEVDYARVFPIVAQRGEGPEGCMTRHWDADRADLLRYAFEQAAMNGCAGNWSYVDGVLGRLRQRGIRNRKQAEDYELERDEMGP